MEIDLNLFRDLFTAFAVGLLIGIERGWKSRAREEGDRVAGIRTFSLTGILGGVVGRLSELTGEWVLAAGLLAVTIMVMVGHTLAYRKAGEIGITTPVALLITFCLGAWAIYGSHLFVFSVAVLVVALLGFKPELHKWVGSLDDREVYAGIKLLIISVIMLPLLPNQGYGPFEALNPYWLWLMVVLITGISFVGYVTTKRLGDRLGILLTALTGGLASSTAVTLGMAGLASRTRVRAIFMIGVLVASSIMFVRILIEVAVVNAGLLTSLWIPMLTMLGVTLLGMVWLWRTGEDGTHPQTTPLELSNPFQISTALKFGGLLAAILLLAEAMKVWFGHQGIYVLALVSGLMDVDAITLTLSRMAQSGLPEHTAVTGIILATLSNTLVKGSMFAFMTNFRESLKLLIVMLASGVSGVVAVVFIPG